MAISVGSVEVDVIPNTQGIYARLNSALIPAATRVGDDMGRVMGQRISVRLVPAIRDAINAGGRAARPAAGHQGDDAGGAFSRALKARLEAAFRAMPKLQVGADTTEADADLQALRVRMETLANKRIGIDIEAEAAKAEIKLIEAELKRLGAEHPNVQVRADTATALGELAAVRAAIDGVDGKTARVNVSTGAALSAVLQLAVAIGGLAIIPAIPILAAGIGAIGAAAVAAAVGVGALAAVAIPAFIGIAGALQAQKAAQEAATASSLKGAQASSKGSAQALQMAGAQQALAAAERNGARQIAQAQQQVRQARQAAADAAAQAAQRNADAARKVQEAERSLADAQKAAAQSQKDLTAARKTAAEQLVDLNNRLADAQLSQRDAEISLAEATAARDKVLQSATASDLDKQKALLAYDQAVQRLKEQTTETGRLKTETAAANKAGVEGSKTVKDAQDQVAKSQRAVADQARAVKDAQADAARTQVETARQVAQAQERVSEATANVAVAQQSAADAVASAQRQIASASLSAAGGTDQAALAQEKYRQALAKLTPSARQTFNAFVNLRTAFSAWSKALQPQVMPLFTRAIDGLRRSLPGLTPFVLAAARGIGELQDKVSAGFKSPWWQSFKKDLAGSIEPAIVGMGTAFGRLFKGMAGLIQAFLPHMGRISEIMQSITGRFSNWATNLKGSPAFENFLSYSAQMAPVVASALRDMLGAVLRVAKALAPAATVLYLTLGAAARVIGAIAEDLPWLIQLIYGVWIATKLWTLAQVVFNAVMSANPITLIIIGIIALVAAVIYAYKNFGWFRTAVDAVWSTLKTGALFVWNNVLKPTFTAITTALRAIGTAASWLWNTILSPVFSFIATAAKIFFTALVVVVLLPIIATVKLLGAHFKWLYEKAIKPAMDGIGAAASWLWTKVLSPVFGWIGDKAKWLWEKAIKPAWNSIKTQFDALGTTAKWVWDKVLSPVFGWIGDKGKWLYDKALKPAFDNIMKGIKAVGDSFKDAKDFIGKQWSKVQDIAKKPVRFIIDKIYNAGIVPTWNLIAKAFGAPKIAKMETEGWARGGILPGQSSWRNGDDQLVPMRRGEGVYVSEAMRDPFERARLHAVNRAAMSGKSLAPYQGQGFAMGGIFDWVGSTASKGVDLAKSGVSWLKDGVKASAEAGLNAVVKPLLSKIAGSKSLYRDMVTGIPKKMVRTIVDYSDKADTKLGQAGIGGGGFKAGLKWARTQAGKAYQWGGNGNPSWDCSGFVSAIESVIRGQKPHRRWATGAFSGKTAPPGWVLNGKSPYMIGITNAGVGHTAGTLNGVNVESRGGDGVVVGSRARSYMDPLFTARYAYKGTYDQGGYLQPGLNLAYNGTGRPEPVFTSQQANALMGGGAAAGPSRFEGDLYLDSGEFLGRVRGEAQQVVDAGFVAVRRSLSNRS